jgi:hypothetical protein
MLKSKPPFLALLSFAILSAGCSEAGPTEAGPSVEPAFSRVPSHALAGLDSELAAVRALTAPYHEFAQAHEAGYTELLTPCLSSPEGAMGFHYGKPEFLDGSVNAMEPEVLVYEPMKNGKLRLVAVEYIVPLPAWMESAPPTLFGQEFHRNEGAGIWALHVWLWKHNPSGLFANWNPTVTCEYAGA